MKPILVKQLAAIAVLLVFFSCNSTTELNLTSTAPHAVSKYVIVGTADSAGVYISNDQGATWQKAAIDLTGGQKIAGFAVQDSLLYCTSPGAGVFLSTDNGYSWTKTSYPGTNAQAITFFDNTILVADNDAGVYSSQDQGSNWFLRNTQLRGSLVHAFAGLPNALFAGTERKGVAILTNAGFSWDTRDSLQSGSDVHTLALNSTGVFAGTNGLYLFYSSDLGSTWRNAPVSQIGTNVWILLNTDSVMFAGTTQGVLSSTSGGLSWYPFTATMSDKEVRALGWDGANVFAGTNGQGLYRSGDYGQSWVPTNNGLQSRTISAILVR